MVLDAVGLVLAVGPLDLGGEGGVFTISTDDENLAIEALLDPVPNLHGDLTLFGHCVIGVSTRIK